MNFDVFLKNPLNTIYCGSSNVIIDHFVFLCGLLMFIVIVTFSFDVVDLNGDVFQRKIEGNSTMI